MRGLLTAHLIENLENDGARAAQKDTGRLIRIESTIFTMASSTVQSSPVVRRLYRSLLKSARPFTALSPNAKVLTSLLHRTGLEDQSWEVFLRDHGFQDVDAEDISAFRKSKDGDAQPAQSLFRRLLREVISSSPTGIRATSFPAHEVKLTEIIRREFKQQADSCSARFDEHTRKEVAFMSLRELNKKLAWAASLEKNAPEQHPRQAARHVSPLPLDQPSSYLQRGAYLLAHPHLTGYFRRSVICILDHTEEANNTVPGQTQAYGTYGLVVNSVILSPQSGKNLALSEVLRDFPSELKEAFGGSFVKEGGPVHVSLQMLHAATPEQDFLKIGGSVIPMIAQEDESTALNTNEAIYYQGDVTKAADAVMKGELEKDDVTFFVGATSWAVGQLESEIERGCWLPCRGPPQIAHTGICDHEPAPDGKPRPKADLWLSMMSACGEDEAKLAHLVWKEDGHDDLGAACDSFR
jgi:putative AlgH/UPF0301 family transcriptional regulator